MPGVEGRDQSRCNYVITEPGRRGEFIDINGDGALDYVFMEFGAGGGAMYVYPGAFETDGLPGPLLTTVVTPGKATYTARYERSTIFGEAGGFSRPVVVELSLSGQHLEPSTTRYWYGNPARAVDWYEPDKFEDLGFRDTWVQDSASLNVRHTEWRADSHALVSSPKVVQVGKGTRAEPALAATPGFVSPPEFIEYRRTEYDYGVKPAGANACSGSTISYPLRVVPTRTTELTNEGGLWARVETIVACADVDAHGNVLRTETTPRLGAVWGATLITEQKYELVGGGNAPNDRTCKNSAPRVTTTKSERSAAGGSPLLLLHEVALFDDKCHPVETYAMDGTAKTNRSSMTYGAALGQLSAVTAGGFTKSYSYDAQYALYVTKEEQSDGMTTLATTFGYDLDTGLRLSASGPTVTQHPDPSFVNGARGITRYYAYDLFGRPVATAKQPFVVELENDQIPYVPRFRQATDVVEATEYFDDVLPRAVKTYRFAVPRSFSVGATSNRAELPTSDDVMIATTYVDELGRAIQVRERLGGGDAGSPSAQISQWLGADRYRVSKAVFYDASGRAVVSTEPFYTTGAAFHDYGKLGGLPPLRATVTSYDDRSRPWCVSHEYASGAVPRPLSTSGECVSNSTDGTQFALRTRYLYGGMSYSGMGPYGEFVWVATVPPELNDGGSSGGGFTKYLGPIGEELGSMDPDGNRVWVERDALGREIASWRDKQGDASTPKPTSSSSKRDPAIADAASWVQYNTAGQVERTWDANAPTVVRESIYDEQGRLIRLIVDSNGNGLEYQYGAGGLGRVTAILEVAGGMAGRVIAQNHYDVPYNGEQQYCGAAPGACYLAGKLSWTESKATTAIAYGYDDAGRVTRRDQWFQPLGAKRITMSSTYGADGRVLEAILVNPFDVVNPFTYEAGYDTAGRPVVLTGHLGDRPTTTYYEAVSQGDTGAYDALGRVPTMRADNGMVRSSRIYGAQSGMLLGEAKCFLGSGNCTANGTFFDTDPTRTSYTGRNLKAFTDRATSTIYANAYRPSGRLSTTTATPVAGASVVPITQDYAEVFDYNAIGNISIANWTKNASPESSQAGRARAVVNETYTPVSPAPNQIVDKVATITSTRFVNGIPVSDAGPTVDYAYDVEGHLTAVTRSYGDSETLYYGPSGELAYRTVGERTIYYVGEYATVTQSGGVVEMDAHVVFAGTRIASVKPSRTLYCYRSRLGSVVATSLAGGQLGAQYRYTPYGAVDVAVGETPATASELGYTNALRLTGDLLYLKTRVYDAQARVFIQPDSVDRLRYAYVSGDPVNFADPSGLMAMRSAEAAVEATFAAFQAQFGVAPVEERRNQKKAPESTKPPAEPATEQARNEDSVALQPEQQVVDTASGAPRANKDGANEDAHRVNDSAMADDAGYQKLKTACLSQAPCKALWNETDKGEHSVTILPRARYKDGNPNGPNITYSPGNDKYVPGKGQPSVIYLKTTDLPEREKANKAWYPLPHELHHAARNQQGKTLRDPDADHEQMRPLKEQIRNAARGARVP
jgi:RHS repeat-associated protein